MTRDMDFGVKGTFSVIRSLLFNIKNKYNPCIDREIKKRKRTEELVEREKNEEREKKQKKNEQEIFVSKEIE